MAEAETFLDFARKQRDELMQEWIKDGCTGSFYSWLLERVEKALTKKNGSLS